MTRSGKKKALDQIRERIFDTETYGAAASVNGTRQFFSNIQNKLAWQTNLKQANFLEKDVSFKVLSLALKANVGFGDKILLPELIEKSALAFSISDRDFWKGSARFAAGGITGLCEYSGGGAITDYAYLQLGQPTEHGVFFGKEYFHHIPSQYSFKVEITATGVVAQPVVDLNLQCVLDGLRRRPML